MRFLNFRYFVSVIVLVGALLPAASADQPPSCKTVRETIVSKVLGENRVGLGLSRTIQVILPPSYDTAGRAFPVVYYCHNLFTNPDKMLADGKLVTLLERGFASAVTQEFILVMADYSTSTVGSFYENSTFTGRWLDYTIQEIVPFIDSHFRTLPHANNRALVGDMMGGRGVFQLAMQYPDTFGMLYAMNPVATASGTLPTQVLPDWEKIYRAKSFEDLKGDGIAQIFVAMAQAYLPNPDRPPFYCDFLMERVTGELRFDPEHAERLKNGFLLDRMSPEHAANLRRLRAIAMDWSRYDPIQDHVFGSQSFTRKLEGYGIDHEAEEYRGVYWAENWADHGRFYARVLPFLARNLEFSN